MIKYLIKQLTIILTNTDIRIRRVAVVAGSIYLGRLGQGLAVLITLPMVRDGLNAEMFGLWMMLTALMNFMAFADLGIGYGVLNEVNKARTEDDKLLLHRTLVSGYVITIATGCLMLLTWIIWSWLSINPTALAGTVSVENQNEAFKALTFFVIVLAINIPASLILRVQIGYQQGYLNGINQLASAILNILFVSITLKTGGNVSELVLATLGVQAVVNVVNTVIWLHRNQIGAGQDWIFLINNKSIKILLKNGVLFFLLQTAAAIAFQSDAIVITQTLGQSAYGDYAVVQKLFILISIFLNSALQGLWPVFGEAIAYNQKEWSIKILKRCVFSAAFVSIIGAGFLMVAMPWILLYWINSTIQPTRGLIFVLALWTVLESIASVIGTFLNGTSILRPQLFLLIVTAVFAFVTKWQLTPIFGATGAVLGTILAYCLISFPGQFYILRKMLISRN